MREKEPRFPHTVVRTIDNPTDKVLLDRSLMADMPVLSCPVCGDPFSHVQAAYSLIGGDEGGTGYTGAPPARQTDYRRDALAVRVHGETCGHRWDVVFQQHKGNTLVRVDVLKDMEESE